MKRSFIIPTLLNFIGVFFISGGVGLRSLNVTIPILGITSGLVFFLLASYLSRDLTKNEEQNKNIQEN
ncbi:MAG TPA: hypothetical protein VK142_08110 [Bacillota bacterium]|nr:hypothetical protein [Bacillota bacterium]